VLFLSISKSGFPEDGSGIQFAIKDVPTLSEFMVVRGGLLGEFLVEVIS